MWLLNDKLSMHVINYFKKVVTITFLSRHTFFLIINIGIVWKNHNCSQYSYLRLYIEDKTVLCFNFLLSLISSKRAFLRFKVKTVNFRAFRQINKTLKRVEALYFLKEAWSIVVKCYISVFNVFKCINALVRHFFLFDSQSWVIGNMELQLLLHFKYLSEKSNLRWCECGKR